MKEIPQTDNSPVLRTDFSDDAAWDAICAAIRQPSKEFQFIAYVDFLSDPAYDGLTPEQIRSHAPEHSGNTFLFVVDRVTFTQSDHPILVIDLYKEPGRTFRVIPSEMCSVQNNLSISNMDFEEFANAVDEDGVFRGFPES